MPKLFSRRAPRALRMSLYAALSMLVAGPVVLLAPGFSPPAFAGVISGDFDGDSDLDCNDLDLLSSEIAAGTNNLAFDLNGDSLVSLDDLDAWLSVAGNDNGFADSYLLGDANLDGSVDGQDFIIWNAAKFTVNSSWCSGDFNADGFVDGLDFIIWNSNKFQSIPLD